jgi:MoxR-like ATPase
VSAQEILLAQEASQSPRVDDKIYNYLVQIAKRTREDTQLSHGVSVRALKDLISLCKSRAWLRGLDYVTPDDVQKMAIPCLSHRIAARQLTSRALQEEYIRELLRQVPLPL